jgi:hypothetical protein
MRQLLEIYNNAAQRFEDFAFKHILPPVFKLIEIALKVTLFYSFYLLAKNAINEVL